MPPAVVIENVGKRFKLARERNHSLKATVLRGRRTVSEEFWALRDVSFEIPEGSTFGLIGANGSGKSTLLKCMAKILRPNEGRIVLDGQISALLELGAGFHPELTGRENIFLNGSILGLNTREVKQRIDDIVSFAGLEEFIDEPVKTYSSGMYVRLGFAIAINVDPDVLLVDEVMAVGDAEFQQRCKEKFNEYRRAGKTVVVVSHALETVATMCDELAWLDHGKVVEVGSAAKVVANYQVASGAHALHSRNGAQSVQMRDGIIRSIELLDAADRPVDTVASGGTARVRVRYDADLTEGPVTLALGFYRADGAHVASINAGSRFHDPVYEAGMVTVDYAIERMPLLPAVYELSVALHDRHIADVFERKDRVFRFQVTPGADLDQGGLVALLGEWSAARQMEQA